MSVKIELEKKELMWVKFGLVEIYSKKFSELKKLKNLKSNWKKDELEKDLKEIKKLQDFFDGLK